MKYLEIDHSMLDTPKFLITGAHGQLGRAFQAIFPDAMFVSQFELDLVCEPKKIHCALQQLSPSAIIHTAAYTNVDAAQSDHATAMRVNGFSTGTLVEYCREHNIPIIYYSTDYVLDSCPSGGHVESEVPQPRSVYGISKYIGELCVNTYGRGTVIRLSSVFGDGTNFPLTMLKLSESHDVIPVVCDQVMRPTYASDVAQATHELLRHYWIQDEWLLPSVLHMQNSGSAVTWSDFAKQIFFQTKKKTRVQEITFEEYVTSRADKITAPRPQNSLFDMSLLESLGVPLRNWTEALHEFCESGVSRQLQPSP